MSGWRHVEIRMTIEQMLYTDQSREEIEEAIAAFASDDLIDRFCDCDGHEVYDADDNPDRWTKSRWFPACRVQVGGCRWQVIEGLELEREYADA